MHNRAAEGELQLGCEWGPERGKVWGEIEWGRETSHEKDNENKATKARLNLDYSHDENYCSLSREKCKN